MHTATILITGSREFGRIHAHEAAHRQLMDQALRTGITLLQAQYGAEIDPLIVHGDARGADTLAARWAVAHNIRCEAVPARWDLYGKAAGPRRNIAMLETYAPELVLGFPLNNTASKSRGTYHCMRAARERGRRVVCCTYGDDLMQLQREAASTPHNTQPYNGM